MVLYDRFGRPVTNLRISLNSSFHCNLACIFCHMEGVREPSDTLMTPEEIERIVGVLHKLGVKTVKLTGGEPMLRNDIVEIVQRIRSLGVREISMTSNGARLVGLARTLKAKGLSRVNISLHSLKRDRFRFITQSSRLDGTLDAIHASVEADLRPVKINITLLKGVNEDEVFDFVEFSRSLGGGKTNILQLIELVATDSSFYKAYHADLTKLEEELARRAVAVTERALHRRRRYELPSGVTVETVRPMHNSAFCMGNNRMRITHDGKFKPCLLRDDNHVDFLGPMRSGASDDKLEELFHRAVLIREPYFRPGAGEARAHRPLPFATPGGLEHDWPAC